jgi:hypothetical protein
MQGQPVFDTKYANSLYLQVLKRYLYYSVFFKGLTCTQLPPRHLHKNGAEKQLAHFFWRSPMD